MRKLYIIFLNLIIGLSMNANPIALPMIEISELYFDESDNWKLELGYFEVNQSGYTIDSIFFYSTIDSAKLPSFEFIGSSGLMVITTDSFNTNFFIKRYADTLKIVFYMMEEPFEDILIFGDMPGASISYPRQGQSISKFGYYFSKDNSPTIGFSNDSLGMCGTLKGIIYDKYSEPIGSRTFKLDYYNFTTSENGEFSVREYSRPTSFIRILYEAGQNIFKMAYITKISYVMEPDSVVELDIHLLDTLEATSINDLNIANTPITVYPNPVSKNEELKINIDLPVIASDIYLEIIDLNGKIIKKKKISQNSSSIIAPDKNGFYIIRTLLDSEIISSNRVIVSE